MALLQDVLAGVVPAVFAKSFERVAGSFVSASTLLS